MSFLATVGAQKVLLRATQMRGGGGAAALFVFSGSRRHRRYQ